MSNDILVPRTFSVEGMTCSSCVRTVERAINEIPGASASVNFASETVHVLAPNEISEKVIMQAVHKAGYEASSLADNSTPSMHSKKSGWRLFFAALFAIPVIASSMYHPFHSWLDTQTISIIDQLQLPRPLYSPSAWVAIALSFPLIFIVAWPIHRAAIRNLLHPTMDTLVSLGSLTAYAWSIYANATGAGDVYTEVAAGVLLFVILGRYLESRAKKSASSALSSLLELGAKEVTVLRSGEEVLVPISHLKVGDHFVVKPGERIPTDGVVVEGFSTIDNSMITGESLPIEATVGTHVIGATINHKGRIVVEATRIGSDTELARITAMVVEAQGKKSPIQATADRISAIFVPTVTTLALATYAAWYFTGHGLTLSISRGIAVLVIACPCALGLATPVALLVASGRGALRGIVIRQPRVLEAARHINAVVLDKTGTITSGVMKVHSSVIPAGATSALGQSYSSLVSEQTVLSTAYALESQNNHPVGRAISLYAMSKGARKFSVTEFSETPGSGVAARVNIGSASPVVIIGSPAAVQHSCIPFHQEISDAITGATSRGFTPSVLAWDGVAIAVFATGDQIKEGSKEAIAQFKARGIEPWLMTGDNPQTAQDVADAIGIDRDHVFAQVMPETKLMKLRNIQRQEKKVMMIGDGINDAGALTAADVSAAMGTGTDTAIGAADITLMNPSLESAIAALDLSKKTYRVIRTNLAWAFAYNIIGIPIAAAGLLSPMYAAAAMALSSLFVVTNSLRIR